MAQYNPAVDLRTIKILSSDSPCQIIVTIVVMIIMNITIATFG